MELMPSLVISFGKGRKSLFTARHHSGQHFEVHSWQTVLVSFFFFPPLLSFPTPLVPVLEELRRSAPNSHSPP